MKFFEFSKKEGKTEDELDSLHTELDKLSEKVASGEIDEKEVLSNLTEIGKRIRHVIGELGPEIEDVVSKIRASDSATEDMKSVSQRCAELAQNSGLLFAVHLLAEALFVTLEQGERDLGQKPRAMDLAGMILSMLVRLESSGKITINK